MSPYSLRTFQARIPGLGRHVTATPFHALGAPSCVLAILVGEGTLLAAVLDTVVVDLLVDLQQLPALALDDVDDVH